jgi:hypothetical protein
MSCVTTPVNEMFVEVGDRSTYLFNDNILDSGAGTVNNYGVRAEAISVAPNLLTQSNPGRVNLKTGKAYVVMRPTPWDDRWQGITGIDKSGVDGQRSFVSVQDYLSEIDDDRIPMHQKNALAISDDDVFDYTLMRTGSDVSTSWQIMSTLSSIDSAEGDKASPPIYSKELTTLYGHNPQVFQLKGMDASQIKLEYGGQTSDYIMSYTRKMMDWFKWSDHYLQGSINVPLNPFFRIGQWLWFGPRFGKPAQFHHRYYYVTNVSHNYDFATHSALTTLTVIRGTPARMSDRSRSGARFRRAVPQWKKEGPRRLVSEGDQGARRAAAERQAAIHAEVEKPW